MTHIRTPEKIIFPHIYTAHDEREQEPRRSSLPAAEETQRRIVAWTGGHFTHINTSANGCNRRHSSWATFSRRDEEEELIRQDHLYIYNNFNSPTWTLYLAVALACMVDDHEGQQACLPYLATSVPPNGSQQYVVI